MDCKFLTVIKDKSFCKIAYELSGGLECETSPEACSFCMKTSPSQAPNSVTASLATKAVKDQAPDKLQETIERLRPFYLTMGKKNEELDEGPGKELRKLLSWFATDTPDCECKSRAKKMNTWGVEGCRNNIETILDWLQEEAEKRGLPYVRFIAKQLVLLAISRAEKCIQKDASSST
jgi:hypothetical protein